MIKPSGISHEFYYDDLPGTLQYTKNKEDLILCGLDAEKHESPETCGYILCEHSKENLKRITPNTSYFKSKGPYKILLVMKCVKNDEIWLKCALVNKNGDIALLTSTNSKDNLIKENHKTVKTLDGVWFIGHYRMSAPLCFWIELKNRLLY